MKTLSSVTTRRDRCYLFGRRGQKLPGKQMIKAWQCLSVTLEMMGDMDMPRFEHLLEAFRYATIGARQKGIIEQLNEMPPLDPSTKTPDLEKLFQTLYALDRKRKSVKSTEIDFRTK